LRLIEMKGLIGKKIGMTQVEDSAGSIVAVTVIEAGPCVVVQKKTTDTDGYDAVQLGFIECKEKAHSKAGLGHFKKAGVTPRKYIQEFRSAGPDELNSGDSVTVEIFKDTDLVDITGVTKGRGFQGAVKRHRMAGGRHSHGGHSKRRIGSIGQCSYPARVQKGKRMPGHMGNTMITIQGLSVVSVREEDNVLLVRGAVPGPNGSIITICKSIKAKTGRS
jgi:large subunit ribosomal protein L3